MPTGRPTVLTEAKRRQISAFVADGFSLPDVARYIGVSLRTLRRELRRNPQLAREVADAELSARLDPEKMLRQAAAENWRAAAWLLERTNPQRFARTAPRGLDPAAVAAGIRRLIEVALGEFVDRGARNGAYARLSAAADEITAALANPNPAQRRRTPFTPLVDAADLDAMLQDAADRIADADPLLSTSVDKTPPTPGAPERCKHQGPQGFTASSDAPEAKTFVPKNTFF